MGLLDRQANAVHERWSSSDDEPSSPMNTEGMPAEVAAAMQKMGEVRQMLEKKKRRKRKSKARYKAFLESSKATSAEDKVMEDEDGAEQIDTEAKPKKSKSKREASSTQADRRCTAVDTVRATSQRVSKGPTTDREGVGEQEKEQEQEDWENLSKKRETNVDAKPGRSGSKRSADAAQLGDIRSMSKVTKVGSTQSVKKAEDLTHCPAPATIHVSSSELTGLSQQMDEGGTTSSTESVEMLDVRTVVEGEAQNLQGATEQRNNTAEDTDQGGMPSLRQALGMFAPK